MQRLIDFWNNHSILTVLSGLFAFIPLVSWLFRLLLQLSLKLISKLSGRAIEQQQLRDKIIDIVSRPLLALLSTLRFGLSFWFDKKEIKWIQYIIRADEDLLHWYASFSIMDASWRVLLSRKGLLDHTELMITITKHFPSAVAIKQTNEVWYRYFFIKVTELDSEHFLASI